MPTDTAIQALEQVCEWARLEESNRELESREARLEQAIFALLASRTLPRTPTAKRILEENLRQEALEFCKTLNLDSEIWKSIES